MKVEGQKVIFDRTFFNSISFNVGEYENWLIINLQTKKNLEEKKSSRRKTIEISYNSLGI